MSLRKIRNLVLALVTATAGMFACVSLPAHALSVGGIVSNPIGSVTDTVSPLLTGTTDTVTDTAAPVTQSTDTGTSAPSSQQAGSTASEPSSTPAASTQTRSGARTTRADDGAVAGDQRVSATPGVTYGSGQISPEMADMLYRLAAGAGIVGFIIYAATVLPLRRSGRVAVRRTALRMKAGH